MNRYFLWLFVSMNLIGCSNFIEIFPFNDEDMKWVNVYNENDTCIFSCQESNDTMIIYEKYIRKADDYHFWDIFNLKKNNWLELTNSYNGFGYYKVCFKHNGITDSSYFSFRKIDEKNISISFYLFESETRNNEIEFGICPKIIPLILNGKLYKNCIVLDSTNCEFTHNKYINSIGLQHYIWDKNNGLLQYKLNNGKTYNLNFEKTRCHKLFH